MHATHAEVGQDGQREDDDGQAADPLGHTAPEEDVFRHGLDVGQDGGSRGGETRQGFKEAIGEVGHALAEQKGMAPNNESTSHEMHTT